MLGMEQKCPSKLRNELRIGDLTYLTAGPTPFRVLPVPLECCEIQARWRRSVAGGSMGFTIWRRNGAGERSAMRACLPRVTCDVQLFRQFRRVPFRYDRFWM